MTSILLVLFTLKCYSNSKEDYENAKAVKESKLLVVLSDKGCALDDSIKSNMNRYWTFCNYDFIKESEYDKYIVQEGYSILSVLAEVPNGYKNIINYSYFLKLGSKKNKNLNTGWVAKKPVPCFEDENKKIVLTTYDYLISYFIKTIQNQLEYDFNSKGIEEKEKLSKEDMGNNIISYNKGGHAKLSKMKIILCKDDVKNVEYAKSLISTITSLDKTKIELVSSEEIFMTLAEGKDDIAIFFQNYSVFKIFAAKDLETLAYGAIGLGGGIYHKK